ncbi:MAG: hypothetical protein IJ876_00490 [Elusimicrobiaceae bacterium]|nr:hypothetical protein [Elusimicrobiaceae bacterium]
MKYLWMVLLMSLLFPLAGYGQRLPLKSGRQFVRMDGGSSRVPVAYIRNKRIQKVPDLKGLSLGVKLTPSMETLLFHNSFFAALQRNIEKVMIGTEREQIMKMRWVAPLYMDVSAQISKTVALSEQQNFRYLLEESYRDVLLTPGEWNLRKIVEQKVVRNHLTLLDEALFLDVMSLEFYMHKHRNEWPLMGTDPEIDKLNKHLVQALWDDNLSGIVVALRRQATNIPAISTTVQRTETFIKKHKRMPGLVYLHTPEYTGISITADEKNLGMDMQFLAVTNLAEKEKFSSASLAKLIDQWECYYVIALDSGIPERDADGTANIPVYTKAQWQKRLERWVHSDPVMALLRDPRSYSELLQAHNNVWEEQLASAKQQASAEQVNQWWELMRPVRETSLQFSQWNDFERSEALINAARSLELEMPVLTHAEWDAELQQWIETMGIPRNIILENSETDEIEVDELIEGTVKIKPFKEMDLLEKREEVFGQIYYNHIYPEEFIARLREAGEL